MKPIPMIYPKVKEDLFRKTPIYPPLVRKRALEQYKQEQQVKIEKAKREAEAKIAAKARRKAKRRARRARKLRRQAEEQQQKQQTTSHKVRSGGWWKIEDGKV